VNNIALTVLRLGAVTPGAVVLIQWTGSDGDSEDTNGVGFFDLLGGEDRELDGIFDASFLSVAFDYSIVQDGENPSADTDAALAQRMWIPCSQAVGVGDTAIDAITTPVGATHDFAWDWQNDPTFTGMRVILSARGFDGQEHTATVYHRAPVTLGQ
jgi:hypothetical protein